MNMLSQLHYLCTNNPEVAERQIEQMLWASSDPNLYNFDGLAKKNLGKYAAAIDSFKKACRFGVQDHVTYFHLAMCYRSLGRLEEACDILEKNVKDHRSDSNLHNLAKIYMEMLRLDEAKCLLDEALLISPNASEFHVDLSYTYGLMGSWRLCFEEYEWRFQYFEDLKEARDSFSGSPWSGEALDGKSLLVYCEQGYGDWIMFARYLQFISGGHVILYVPSSLVRLFSRLEIDAEIVDACNPVPIHDFHCSVMSLPFLLGQYDICGRPYFPSEITPMGKIGIVPSGKSAPWRAIPIDFFSKLEKETGREFVSLQYGEDNRFPYFLDGVQDFEDTRKKMESLDLLITSDTALMHLAGAMGLPCWALIWYYPHWIWPVEKQLCPWYDCVRCFRQTVAGEWSDVFNNVLRDLESQ